LKKGPLDLNINESALTAAYDAIKTRVYEQHGLVEMQSLSEKQTQGKSGKNNSIPIIENPNEYSTTAIDLSNLVSYPPKLMPVPAKPLFFDIAWNYIDYPGRTPATRTEVQSQKAEEVDDEKKPAKRGWFGFGRS
jgi:signal recognition particle subunit SRP68